MPFPSRLTGPPAIAVAAITLAAAACPAAATVRADPATLDRVLRAARGGDAIVLAPGDYGRVTFPERAFSPAIRLDARAARFDGIVLAKVSGVAIGGGSVTGGRDAPKYAVSIDKAGDVEIADMAIGGTARGIVVAASRDVRLIGNRLDGLRSDGIDIASSQRIRVERNSCRNFSPTPPVWDAAGKKVRDGDHPDCIQAWSRPGLPPTADLAIIDNVAEGNMQGIFLGNHVRKGVDDGGFDRVVIRGNRVTVAVPNGIVAMAARDSEVRDNIVRTVPGASFRKGLRTISVKAALRASGEGMRSCGNQVEAVRGSPGTERCKRR